MTDPNFAGADGKFSRALFDEALRQSGYTEDGFLAGQRVVYLRGQIAEAMAGSMSAPPSMIAMLHRYRQEQRSITMMTPWLNANSMAPESPVEVAPDLTAANTPNASNSTKPPTLP